MPDNSQENKTSSLLQYAGLGAQFLISIGIGVFLGLKADQWLKLKIPLLIWILPLLILTGMMMRLIKETSKKK